MAKIYFARHQAHGVVQEFPFAGTPSDAQLEQVRKFCFGIHGASHPKTPDEPYWIRVEERAVLGANDQPQFEVRGLEVSASGSALGEFTVAGTGTVTPKT